MSEILLVRQSRLPVHALKAFRSCKVSEKHFFLTTKFKSLVTRSFLFDHYQEKFYSNFFLFKVRGDFIVFYFSIYSFLLFFRLFSCCIDN